MEDPYSMKLKNKWTLYSSLKNSSKDKYMQCKTIENFESIESIGKFMEMNYYLNNPIKKNISGKNLEYLFLENKLKFIHEEDFFFMKNDILPLWEDEKNKNGGAYSIKINFLDSFNVWDIITRLLVCGSYNNLENINGVQISLKKNNVLSPQPSGINNVNSYCCFIKIWNNDKNNFPKFTREIIHSFEKEFNNGIYTAFMSKDIFGKLPMVSYKKYNKK